MKLFAMTVSYNEAERYLESMVINTREIVDEHFVFDDDSSDDTVEIAADYGCTVIRRSIECPSFLTCEGLFRQQAWRSFEAACQPDPGDWVLVIDCDEVAVSLGEEDTHSTVDSAISCAVRQRALGVTVHISEVFGVDDQGPLVRVDKQWGTIAGPRLVEYRAGGTWPARGLGVPGIPTYAWSGPFAAWPTFGLLHYGYARVEDRQAKYERYHADPGHGSAHVESILDALPVLERWRYGQVPEMIYRGGQRRAIYRR